MHPLDEEGVRRMARRLLELGWTQIPIDSEEIVRRSPDHKCEIIGGAGYKAVEIAAFTLVKAVSVKTVSAVNNHLVVLFIVLCLVFLLWFKNERFRNANRIRIALKVKG